jgi:hypothetical protein
MQIQNGNVLRRYVAAVEHARYCGDRGTAAWEAAAREAKAGAAADLRRAALIAEATTHFRDAAKCGARMDDAGGAGRGALAALRSLVAAEALRG